MARVDLKLSGTVAVLTLTRPESLIQKWVKHTNTLRGAWR
jgi:hypothetical protein